MIGMQKSRSHSHLSRENLYLYPNKLKIERDLNLGIAGIDQQNRAHNSVSKCMCFTLISMLRVERFVRFADTVLSVLDFGTQQLSAYKPHKPPPVRRWLPELRPRSKVIRKGHDRKLFGNSEDEQVQALRAPSLYRSIH